MHSICVSLSNSPVRSVITTQPISQVSQATSNVTFTCAAIANPRALIQWIFNGNVLRNMSDTDGTKYLITNETEGNCAITDPPSQCETSSTLEIFNTQPSDSGEYTCNASNVAGASIESAELIITGILNKLYCIIILICTT